MLRGVQLASDDYIIPPFSPKILAAKIRNILNRYKKVANDMQIANKYNDNKIENNLNISTLNTIIETATAQAKKDKKYLNYRMIIELENDLPEVRLDKQYIIKAFEFIFYKIMETTLENGELSARAIYNLGEDTIEPIGSIIIDVNSQQINKTTLSDIINDSFVKETFAINDIRAKCTSDGQASNLKITILPNRVIA